MSFAFGSDVFNAARVNLYERFGTAETAAASTPIKKRESKETRKKMDDIADITNMSRAIDGVAWDDQSSSLERTPYISFRPLPLMPVNVSAVTQHTCRCGCENYCPVVDARKNVARRR